MKTTFLGLVGIGLLALIPFGTAALAGEPDRTEAAEVRPLIDGLKSTDLAVRFKSAKALGKLGSGAREAIPALIQLAQNDPDEDVRRVAAESLKKIRGERNAAGGTPSAAIESHLRNLRSSDEGVRFKAVKSLRKMGTAARPALATLTRVADNDPDEDVRRVAMESLPIIQGKRLATQAVKPSLVGTWEGMLTYGMAGFKVSMKVRTTFKADGTYSTLYSMDDFVFTENGEYTYAEGILTTTEEGGEMGGIGFGTQATITWNNKDEFLYKGGGSRITFRRK
jgi:hypothetical protein